MWIITAFFTPAPDNLTDPGRALHFYDISLKYALTPRAKGKVERHHPFWQNRLPSCFLRESIRNIDVANEHLERPRAYYNHHVIHRELKQPPQAAWDQAFKEKRCVLRPFRPDPPGGRTSGSVRAQVKVGESMPQCRCRCGSNRHIGSTGGNGHPV